MIPQHANIFPKPGEHPVYQTSQTAAQPRLLYDHTASSDLS